MNPSTWLLAVAALLLLTGCSAANAQPADVAKLATSVTKTTEAASAADADSAEPIPADFAPPFPGNQDFFTPPEVAASQQSGLAKNADGTPEVRVLGFVKLDGGSDRAIVQIGPMTDIVEPGQVIQGVEVISLQEPTITLQFNGARWNVSMFAQAQTADATARGKSRNSRVPDRGSRAMPELPALPGPLQLPSPPELPPPPNIPLPPRP